MAMPCRAVPWPCRAITRSDGGGAGLIPSERIEPILLADYALFLLNRFQYRSVPKPYPSAADVRECSSVHCSCGERSTHCIGRAGRRAARGGMEGYYAVPSVRWPVERFRSSHLCTNRILHVYLRVRRGAYAHEYMWHVWLRPGW